MSQAPASSKPHRRIAGVTIPLFSLKSPRSWGIGEIGDLPEFAAWARSAGLKLVQILPLGEISGGETSPYSALSAFGLDPMYISIADVPELAPDPRRALGGELGELLLGRIQASSRVDYEAVRALKRQALKAAFHQFRDGDLAKRSSRAEAFFAFRERHRAWLEDYALFRALKDAHGGVAWWDWGAALKERDASALEKARSQHEEALVYYEYLQWIAHEQWDAARARLAAMGVEIMGDLPFMVGRDSADVWANQSEFRDDASAGMPPDAFNEEGQEWGLPPYYWARMRANDFAWLRKRVRYMGSLYDRFRIDHLVGFYRSYMRPRYALLNEKGKLVPGVFDPKTEPEQLMHGEQVMRAMLEAAGEKGSTIVAEDLGIVPDFVRASLAKLDVPGYKVLIWEKDGHVFRDPAKYPRVSLACFGTHDTDPVAVWWETRDREEREAVKKLPSLAPHAAHLGPRFTREVHKALFDLLNASNSELVLFLIQDVLGTHDRINTPATVGHQNWTYRLPGTVEQLQHDAEVAAIVAMVHKSIETHGR